MRALLCRSLVCLALVAPVGAAGTAGSAAWETIAPEGAGFAVDMPLGAVYDVSSNLTLAGRIEEHRYSVEAADASFWVTWTTLPRVALWLARSDGILGNVRKEVLGREGVEEVAWEAARAGDFTGRELRYSLQRGDAEDEGRLRAFLKDRTLYVFHGQARTSAGSAHLERLLGSIRLSPGPSARGDETANPVSGIEDVESAGCRVQQERYEIVAFFPHGA